MADSKVARKPSHVSENTLYEHLTWKHLISYISKQISKSVGIIFRAQFYLSEKNKLRANLSMYHLL